MITIQQLLEPFEYVELAKEQDNHALLDFYKNESMKTDGTSISFDRGDDFFAFYRQTTEKFWCFKILNKDRSIAGIATILRHHRLINNTIQPIAYFGDLRISAKANRITVVQWRKAFTEIVKNLTNLGPDEYCVSAYTAILEMNSDAINSLTKGGRGINYRFLNKYYVHSFISTGIFTRNNYEVRKISKNDFLKFYNEINQSVFLAEDVTKMPILEQLDQDDPDGCYIGVFKGNKLCAISRPLFKNNARTLKVQGLAGIRKVILKLLPYFGRPGPRVDNKIKTIDFTYFTYLSSFAEQDVQELIRAIEHWIRHNHYLRDFHLFNIIDTKNHYSLHPTVTGIHFDTIGHLYEIHDEQKAGVLPKTSFRFEGAFL